MFTLTQAKQSFGMLGDLLDGAYEIALVPISWKHKSAECGGTHAHTFANSANVWGTLCAPASADCVALGLLPISRGKQSEFDSLFAATFFLQMPGAGLQQIIERYQT